MKQNEQQPNIYWNCCWAVNKLPAVPQWDKQAGLSGPYINTNDLINSIHLINHYQSKGHTSTLFCPRIHCSSQMNGFKVILLKPICGHHLACSHWTLVKMWRRTLHIPRLIPRIQISPHYLKVSHYFWVHHHHCFQSKHLKKEITEAKITKHFDTLALTMEICSEIWVNQQPGKITKNE